jgi:four helix bundle protein
MATVETLGKIRRFEDLIAWQKARELTRKIYEISRQGDFGRDYGLSGQIQRAAVSIMSNLAEGFERGGLGEFHQFLYTAKASCAELRSQLYVALDVGYINSVTFQELREQSEEVGRIVGGLRASIAKRRAVKR